MEFDVSESDPFKYDAELDPGEKRQIRYEVGENYLSDPVEIPVTIINGVYGGPTVFLIAAIHGDELNGVKFLQEVATSIAQGNSTGRLCVST